MSELDKSLIGKKVIVRTNSAGVHYGTLLKKEGDQVLLENSRRLWRWWAQESISLTGVALHGVKHDKSNICGPLPIHNILGVVEIIPVTSVAEISLDSAPVAAQ